MLITMIITTRVFVTVITTGISRRRRRRLRSITAPVLTLDPRPRQEWAQGGPGTRPLAPGHGDGEAEERVPRRVLVPTAFAVLVFLQLRPDHAY